MIHQKHYVVSDQAFNLNSGLHKAYETEEAALNRADAECDYIYVVTVTRHWVEMKPGLSEPQ